VPARPARRACQHAAGDCFVGGCKGDMVQLWRICTVFFPFTPWPGTALQAGAREIGCNCGAFAPYFFDAFRLFMC